MGERSITRPFDLGLVVGRFQTFHVGHEHLINTALAVADRVLVLIGSGQEAGTLRNPFDVTTREKMIRSIYPGAEITVASLADLDKDQIVHEGWGKHVLQNCVQHMRKIPDVYVYGREDSNLNWFKCSESLTADTRHLTEMVVARERFNISATTLREWMFLDEHQKWAKYTNPKLHKHYDSLRSELLNCKELEALVIKKLRRPPEAWLDKPKSIFAQ